MSQEKDVKNLDKAALNALLSASPEAIQAKLDILKQAISDGTYTANHERIAEELIRELETTKADVAQTEVIE